MSRKLSLYPALVRLRQAKIKLTAALGVCPKCSYGFAGLKPNPDSKSLDKKMVKLEPGDREYTASEPCPGCGFVQVEQSQSQSPVKPRSFGDKYYVLALHGDIAEDSNGEKSVDFLSGPFYDRSEAEAHRAELMDLGREHHQIWDQIAEDNNLDDDPDWDLPGWRDEYGEYKDHVKVLSPDSNPTHRKIVEQVGADAMSPRRAVDKLRDDIASAQKSKDYFEKQRLRDRDRDLDDKPNVASVARALVRQALNKLDK